MNLKRILAGLLSALTLFGSMAVTAFAATDETEVPTIAITELSEKRIAEIFATKDNNRPDYTGEDGLYNQLYLKYKAKYGEATSDVIKGLHIEPTRVDNVNSKAYSAWSADAELTSDADASVFVLVYAGATPTNTQNPTIYGLMINLDSENNHTSRIFDKILTKVYQRAYHFFNDLDYDLSCIFIPVTEEMCEIAYEIYNPQISYELFKPYLENSLDIKYTNKNVDISLDSYVYETQNLEETGAKHAANGENASVKKVLETTTDGGYYASERVSADKTSYTAVFNTFFSGELSEGQKYGMFVYAQGNTTGVKIEEFNAEAGNKFNTVIENISDENAVLVAIPYVANGETIVRTGDAATVTVSELTKWLGAGE